MSCTNCSGSSSSFNIPYNQSVSYCSNGIYDTRCIVYTGPALTCLEVDSNTCLQDVIQSIDSKVCQVIGDYSQYTFNCLSSSYTITNEAEFVDAITQYVCNQTSIITNLTDRVNSNYDDLFGRINNIVNPNLTSPCLAIVYNSSSTLNQIIAAQSTAICNINTTLSLAGVNWSSCYAVTTPPTNIIAGFNEVINQICLTKASITSSGTLPTFDNTGTCLANPTTTDSLVDTITKIRTRLCSSPTFSASNLTASACIGFTSSSTLEQVINLQNAAIITVSQQAVRAVSSDFILSNIDNSQPCLGQVISLNTSVVDRKVALNNADVAPGTLFDKIASGTNVTLDFGVTNPGKLTISATGGVPTDEKVKINSSDPSAGYLEDKLTGDASTGVTVSVTEASDSLLKITAVLDFSVIASEVLTAISNDDDLKAVFCSLVNSCPVTCTAPTNASVTFQNT